MRGYEKENRSGIGRGDIFGLRSNEKVVARGFMVATNGGGTGSMICDMAPGGSGNAHMFWMLTAYCREQRYTALAVAS